MDIYLCTISLQRHKRIEPRPRHDAAAHEEAGVPVAVGVDERAAYEPSICVRERPVEQP